VGDQVDEPRFLHINPARNYTPVPHRSAHGEQEAIDENEQRAQTRAAHRRAAERRLAVYGSTKRMIFGALDDLLASLGSVDHGIASSVRAVKRSTEILGQKIVR
jgi:hypothetical protein